MFLALDAFWDECHDEALGNYLSEANPYLFMGQESADPAIWAEFCSDFHNCFNEQVVSTADAYNFVIEYLTKINEKYSELYLGKKSFDKAFLKIAPLELWTQAFE